MTKRTVTEENIILAYWEQIGHISLPYRYALGRDDAHMEGLLGLLIAIRSYRESYTDFQTYMKQCAIRQLESVKKARQTRYRGESRMSLDKSSPPVHLTIKTFWPRNQKQQKNIVHCVTSPQACQKPCSLSFGSGTSVI